MVEPYFDDMYQRPIHSQRLHVGLKTKHLSCANCFIQYMLAALRDILPVFQKSVHVEPTMLITGFKEEIEGVFQKVDSYLVTPSLSRSYNI